MKTVSRNEDFIDYWQDFGTARKSHFGIRVWVDRCCAITNVGSANPTVLGKVHALPVDFSETALRHSVSNIAAEHMCHHPESDLRDLITGKKPFGKALIVVDPGPSEHPVSGLESILQIVRAWDKIGAKLISWTKYPVVPGG